MRYYKAQQFAKNKYVGKVKLSYSHESAPLPEYVPGSQLVPALISILIKA